MMKLSVIILIVAAALLLALATAVVYFFRFTHRRMDKITDQMLTSDVRLAYRDLVTRGLAYVDSHEHETVSITSFDGLTLRGIYLPIENPRATILCFHGYRAYGLQDFAPMPEFYHSLGLNVLIVDQRACGKSGGKYTTFGILERRDVLAWAQYIDQRLPGLPILLDGLSMGSSSVMLAADLPLPASVRGIIADCGFTSPWEIIAHCGRQWFHIPAFPMVHLLSAVAHLRFGGGYRSCSTLDSLAGSTIPLLLLHGAEDDFVPTYMSEENFKASAARIKRKLIVPGAGHGMSYLVDQKRCQQELRDFVDMVL
ncbi:MAG: alpha/beta hydrolase [Oscillospiraceae bacterium]|nr:alpha/beta hydrolase [Oscillospiraceae bacterium]